MKVTYVAQVGDELACEALSILGTARGSEVLFLQPGAKAPSHSIALLTKPDTDWYVRALHVYDERLPYSELPGWVKTAGIVVALRKPTSKPHKFRKAVSRLPGFCLPCARTTQHALLITLRFLCSNGRQKATVLLFMQLLLGDEFVQTRAATPKETTPPLVLIRAQGISDRVPKKVLLVQ